jgi:tetratricopeptide (TPR) repeat protein
MAENKLKAADNEATPAKRREVVEQADKLYSEVPVGNKYYDSSMWKRGFCRYKELLEYNKQFTEKKKAIPPEALEVMKRLVKEMDSYFTGYDAYVEKHPTFDKQVLDTRASRKVTTPVLRLMAYFYIEDYETVESIAAASVSLIPVDNPNYKTFYWYYFKSVVEQAKALEQEKKFQESDAKLASAAPVIDGMLKHPDGQKDYFSTMCTSVGLTYLDMSKVVAETDKKLSDEFKKKAADWLGKVLLPTDPPSKFISVGILYYQLGAYEEARQMFDQVLQKLDPDGDNKTTDIPPSIFDDLRKTSFESERLTNDYRALLADLKDYLLDAKKADLGKAGETLNKIEKLVPKLPEADKNILNNVRTEIINRNMILSSRTKNVECYVALARAAAEKDPNSAKQLYEQAEKDCLALLNFWPNDRDLTYVLGEIYYALGKYEEAGAAYARTLVYFENGSEKWILANKKIAESAIGAKNYQLAYSYVQGLVNGVPKDDLNAIWPEIDAVMDDLKKKDIKTDEGLVRGKDIATDVLNSDDNELNTQIRTVRAIYVGQSKPPEEVNAQLRGTIEQLIITRMSQKMQTIDAMKQRREIKSDEEELLWRKWSVLRFIAGPCVENEKLRKAIEPVGVMTMDEMKGGTPLRFWPQDIRALAKQYGFIDDKGNILVKDPEAEIKTINDALDKYK